MDEPLSNLDAKLRVQTRTQVSRLQKRLGTTMVYVTHDQTEAMTLGDRVAVMRSGLLQQVGTPQELYERPVNLFVAGFIGSPGHELHAGHAGGGRAAHPHRRHAGQPRQLRQELEKRQRRPRGHRRPPPGELRGRRDRARRTCAATGSPSAPRSTCVESMGSDVFVYFTQDSDLSAHSDQLADLAADVGARPGHAAARRR